MFTPGPWKAQPVKRGCFSITATWHGMENEILAKTDVVVGEPYTGEMKANAILMATSPRMLAACEMALRYLKSLGLESISLGEELVATIAEARGQS